MRRTPTPSHHSPSQFEESQINGIMLYAKHVFDQNEDKSMRKKLKLLNKRWKSRETHFKQDTIQRAPTNWICNPTRKEILVLNKDKTVSSDKTAARVPASSLTSSSNKIRAERDTDSDYGSSVEGADEPETEVLLSNNDTENNSSLSKDSRIHEYLTRDESFDDIIGDIDDSSINDENAGSIVLKFQRKRKMEAFSRYLEQRKRGGNTNIAK
jgi:hypothetical protein